MLDDQLPILERPEVRDFFMLILLTGLRRGEALALRWENVVFDSRTLSIPPEIAKNAHEHRLPLSDFLLVLLAQRKGQCGNSPWVFPRVSKQAVNRFAGDFDQRPLCAGNLLLIHHPQICKRIVVRAVLANIRSAPGRLHAVYIVPAVFAIQPALLFHGWLSVSSTNHIHDLLDALERSLFDRVYH